MKEGKGTYQRQYGKTGGRVKIKLNHLSQILQINHIQLMYSTYFFPLGRRGGEGSCCVMLP